MADLQIEDELAATLSQIAASEQLSVEAFLKTLLDRYRVEKQNELLGESNGVGWREAALNSFIGMFDDDVNDLSESVNDSVKDALRKKHARLD
jgi:hypothetical protein